VRRKRMLRQPPEVQAAVAKLRQIHRRPVVAEPNYAQVRHEVHKLIAQAHGLTIDGGIEARVNQHIDTFMDFLRADMQVRHEAELFELSELRMGVRPLVDGYREKVTNDERTLEEMRYAVAAAVEDIVDDDLPKPSRLRDRELKP
jgi:hypothetical protein